MDKLANLQSALNKHQSDVVKEVTAIATYYPGKVRVYEPFVPIRKLLPDWEANTKTKVNYDRAEAEPKTSNETPEERSIRRSQRKISDYILCNDFNLFATLTFATDRYDIERTKDKLNTWLKNQRDRNGRFNYIIVPEYHKDGALHFHGVFGNYTGRLRQSISAKTNRPLMRNSKPVYEFEEYKSGFTKVQYIGETPADSAKVSNYIRKYITKDMVSIFGKKRYWTSQGLFTPQQEDNPVWYLEQEPDDVYENEYGKIYTYANLKDKILPGYVHLLTDTIE